jgi:carboxymethylenebutenolidase
MKPAGMGARMSGHHTDDAALGALFDLHVRAEFVDRDLDLTMATMVADPFVNHVPTMTGGHGWEAVRAFYGAHFIGKWPADTAITPVSRTIGQGRVVDELLMFFTHDIVMDAFLPGVAPTGRKVEIVVVVIVGTAGGKVAFERIYWDQPRSWCSSASWNPRACRSRASSRPARSWSHRCRPTACSRPASASRWSRLRRDRDQDMAALAVGVRVGRGHGLPQQVPVEPEGRVPVARDVHDQQVVGGAVERGQRRRSGQWPACLGTGLPQDRNVTLPVARS